MARSREGASAVIGSEQRGFAFIEFDSRDQAEDAIRNLDGKEVAGTVINVTIARNKRKSSDEMRDQYNAWVLLGIVIV